MLVRTIALTAGSRSSWRSAPVSSLIRSCDSAFRLSGRFNSRTATPASLIDRTTVDGSAALHAMMIWPACVSDNDDVRLWK